MDLLGLLAKMIGASARVGAAFALGALLIAYLKGNERRATLNGPGVQ